MDRGDAAQAFSDLVTVVQALRTPGTGCPWDLEQTHHTLRPYVIEEAYEVVDAINQGSDSALCEELGDLLLQVVLHAQLAEDRKSFSITEVVRGITDKMQRRHPHVFGALAAESVSEVMQNWEKIKEEERREKGGAGQASALLAGLPQGLPALLHAQRLGEKAARAGVETGTAPSLLSSARDLLAGLQAEVAGEGEVLETDRERKQGEMQGAAAPATRLEQEMGNLLFDLCQLARQLGINAESSLRSCCGRFIASFERPQPAPGPWEPGTGDDRQSPGTE